MASEIRVNQINNRSGLSTITFSDTGVVISGITTISDLRASGNTIVAAGTTAAPSISPTGDSNTGIFFPSPDTIAFAEGGVEAARIDSNANLGIGTTGTSDKLTVLGRVQIQQDSGSNNRLILRGQPGSLYRWNIDNNGSSNDFRIFREDDATTAGGSVYASLSSSGNLTLNNGNLVIGTAGKGIDFSATANSSGTMTSELLSDYEEGTWTPRLVPDGVLTPWTATSSGSYTKIGRVVYLTASIDYTVKTSTGNYIFLTGIPFTPSTTTNIHFVSLKGAGATFYQMYITSDSYGKFLKNNTDGAFGPLIGSEFGASTGTLSFCLCYSV